MLSNREANTDLDNSEEKPDNSDKDKEIEDMFNTKKKHLSMHRLSERKITDFLLKNRKPTHRIVSEIEETKYKIIKNLENIKIFDSNSKKYSSKHLYEYEEEGEHNKFNIYKYIDERKNIKDKLSLYSNNLDSDELHLIEYLHLEPNKRTKFEHKYIKNYLTKTSLMQSLLNLNENKKNINKIINKICLNLKYKFFYTGKTIYEINSIPDNYYYIIEGRVQAYKPEKIFMRMTGFEYFKYIMRLKRDNENYLIDIILNNQTTLVINKSDLPILNYVFFVIIFKEFYSNINFRFYFTYELEDKKFNYESPLDKMLNLCFCDKYEIMKNINIGRNIMESKFPLKDIERQIRKNIPHIPSNLIKYYTPMALDKKLFDVTLFKYKAIVELKKGSFFGEWPNKKQPVREYTIKTVEDCHLSYLEIEIYNNFLKDEKEKITAQMFDYLYNKFFFNQMSEAEFKHQFFESFVFEVKELGHTLTEQNQKLNYIYFIKEGEVSINCNYSINLFMDNILRALKYNNILKYNSQFIELINEFEYFLKSNKKIDFNSLNETSLFIAISRSIIGLDSYFFCFQNYIYSAIVTSSIVKYFKIELKYLLRIFREYYYIKETAQNEAEQKILLIIDRFTKSLKLKVNSINNPLLAKGNINLNTKNEKIKKDINKSMNNNNNYYEYKEEVSINNKKRLNKCIINYYDSNINKENIIECNSSESLIKQKSILEKKILNVSNSIKKKACSMSPESHKIKSLENIKNKDKLKKISIKNEMILVNNLQKNIANNLLFSRLKSKKDMLKTKSNVNILKNISKIKKGKLKPIIINENKILIKNLKCNFKTNKSIDNSEKDNSNSNIKTYRLIKTNIIAINSDKEVKEDNDANKEVEKISSIKKAYAEENKNNNNNFEKNKVNNVIMKKSKSKIEREYYSLDNNKISNYNELFLMKSFSYRNGKNISNKKRNNKTLFKRNETKDKFFSVKKTKRNYTIMKDTK